MRSSFERKLSHRWLAVPAVLILMLLGAACVEQPPQSDPPTPWLKAGCLDNDVPDMPELWFNGVADKRDNTVGFHDRVGNLSSDGTCTGPQKVWATIVRASDKNAAREACASARLTIYSPTRLIDWGFATAPIGAWLCAETDPAAVPR